jgi:uncharacterized membrane protein
MEDNLDKEPQKSPKNESNHLLIKDKDIEDIIKSLPEEKQQKALKIFSSLSIEHSSSFRGPLPPPSILSEYNKVVDNGAERIMKMTENQSGHRIELEKHAIKEELRQSSNGQIYGFVIAIIGITSAFVLAMTGHDAVAGIFGTTTIIALVAVFVIGKKKQNKEG